MKGERRRIVATSVSAARRRSTWLALAASVVWLAAAASSGGVGIWSAIGGAAIALGVAVLLVDRPAAAALLRPSPRLVLLGVLAGGSMAAATYVLYPALARSSPWIATDAARLYAAFRAPSLLVASLALLPVIVGEELVWRGAMQTALVQRFGPRAGVAWAAVAYALANTPIGSPVLVAVALCCGLAWGILRATTASLVPSLIAHLLWNALVLIWLPLA